MTATVEQTQHELARLIRLAIRGEEVLITEEGQPIAKVVGINQPGIASDRGQWLKSLRELREKTSTGKEGLPGEATLAEDRAGRQ